jgi:hypothetical protein
MGALVGFAVGCLPGTQAGRQGLVEPARSQKVISSSEEVRDLVGGGEAVARDLMAHGRGMPPEGIGPDAARLRRVA